LKRPESRRSDTVPGLICGSVGRREAGVECTNMGPRPLVDKGCRGLLRSAARRALQERAARACARRHPAGGTAGRGS